MRLTSVDISGFRGITNRLSLDLNADAVVLSGPNGSGKTSIFDAFLWVLTGSIGRFADPRDVVSHFASSGEAFVSLVVAADDATPMRITRSIARSSERDRLLVELGAVRTEGTNAEALLVEHLWPSAAASHETLEGFSTALTRSVYLQQDLVREFLTDDSEEARFKVLSELVGAGRLTELIRELERARNRWSRVETKQADALLAAERRATTLGERVNRLSLSTDSTEQLGARIRSWWQRVRLISPDVSPPRDLSRLADQPLAIDRALTELDDRRRYFDREVARARALLVDIRTGPTFSDADAAKERSLRERSTAIAAQLVQLRDKLVRAQEIAAAELRRLTDARQSRQELASLARIALRHLGDRCPVCAQTYDRDEARARLEQLATISLSEEPQTTLDTPSELAAAIETAERELAEVQRELSGLESARIAAHEWSTLLAKRTTEVVKPGVEPKEALEQLINEHDDDLELLVGLRAEGEVLTVAATRVVEQSQREQLERDARLAEADAAALRAELSAHARTYDLATEIIAASRTAAWDAVRAQIKGIAPTVERIYARIDPHPVLTDIRLETVTTGQRGKVAIRIRDRIGKGLSLDPSTVLSSSQLNGLAVSLFLALSLAVHDTRLQCVLLDDPLQTLDDINLLGLVDVFRRFKDQRQVILSTHDARFAGLLARKLRPIGEAQRTLEYRFDEWTIDGPAPTKIQVEQATDEVLVAA